MASPPVGVHSYPYGTEMTCLVTNTPFGNTETQFVCVGWSGLGSVPASGFTNTCPAFGLTNDSVIAWAWQKEYWLGAEPDGQGSLDTDSLWLPAGSHIEIEAIPDTYYHLDHWAGDTTGCTIDGTSIEVPLDGSRTIVGGFAANLAPLGTPEWWLAGHGITNAFAVAETNDVDQDGMVTWKEYVADTVPTNQLSVLSILNISPANGGVWVKWQGGVAAAQLLEVRPSLTDTGTSWQAIFTNFPPTPLTTNVLHNAPTGPVFYRIKVLDRASQ